MSKTKHSVKVKQKGDHTFSRQIPSQISDLDEHVGEHFLIPSSNFSSPLNKDQMILKDNETSFQRERQNYLEGFFQELVRNDIEKAHQISIVKKNYLRLMFNIVKCFSNFLGLAVYVVDTYKQIGKLGDPSNFIDNIDLSIAILFSIEYLDDLRRSVNKLEFICSQKSITDLLTILPIFITEFWITHDVLIILKVLRSLRIVRLFNLLHYFIVAQQNNIFKVQEQNQEHFDNSQNKKVTIQIFKILAHIFSLMFMSTGIIMMFEELLPQKAFKMYDKYTQMDFIKGLYFMIVTMSTIGYGDIYPGHTWVRIWLMCTLFVCVAVISNDVTNLSVCLTNVSEYETNYNFSNHVVIVGSYNHFYLWDFVHNFYGDLEHNSTTEEVKETKMIIVGNQEPSEQIMSILEDIILQDKIYYLKAPILEQSFFIQSNVKKAKALFAFCDNENENEQELFLFCKDLHFVASSVDIVFFHGKTKSTRRLKLNFKVKEQFHAQTVKDYLLGTMIMNKGLQVHLNQISGDIPVKCKIDNDLCKKYSDASLQGIHRVKASPYFFGQTTQRVSKILYSSSLLFNKNKNTNQLWCDFGTSAVIFLGLIPSNYISKTVSYGHSKTFFKQDTKKRELVNYQKEQIIKRDDYFVLYCHLDQISFVENFSEDDMWKYEHMTGTLEMEEHESDQEINRMMENNYKKYKIFQNFEGSQLHYKVMTFHRYQRKEGSANLPKRISVSKQELSKQPSDGSINAMVTVENVENGYINLYSKSDQLIELQIEDHIIIIGPQSGITNIVKAIRRYTSRYIIFFTEDIFIEKEFKPIQELGNIVYTYGSYFNVHHLSSLQFSKSYRTLILRQDGISTDTQVRDLNCLILQRAIYQIAPGADIIYEIQENPSLHHCLQKPNSEFENEYLFYPQLLSGNVFVGSSLYTVVSRTVFNDTLIAFIKAVIGYNLKDCEDFHNQKMVHTLTLDMDMVEQFSVYGVVAHHLLQRDIVPLALITAENTSILRVIENENREKERQKQKHRGSQLKRQSQNIVDGRQPRPDRRAKRIMSHSNQFLSPEARIAAFQEKMKTKERVNMTEWEGCTVVSNPPAMHVLRAGDKVVIFGKIDLSDQQKRQIMLQNPEKLKEKSRFRKGFLLAAEPHYEHEEEDILLNSDRRRLHSLIKHVSQPKTGKERIELRGVVLLSLKSMIQMMKMMDRMNNSQQRLSTQ